MAGFVFDQDTPPGLPTAMGGTGATIRAIERWTGLDFFHWLAAPEQDRIETGAPGLLAELGCGP